MQGNLATSGDLVRVEIETTLADGRRTRVAVDCSCVEDAGWLLLAMGVDDVITGHRQLDADAVQGWWTPKKKAEPLVKADLPVTPPKEPTTPRTPTSPGGKSKRAQILEFIEANGPEGCTYAQLSKVFGASVGSVTSQLKGAGLLEQLERGRCRAKTQGGGGRT